MEHRSSYFFIILWAVFNSAFASSLAVCNSVNVITGEYMESCTDLRLTGPHSVAVQRTFTGQGNGWRFNHPSIWHAEPNATCNAKGYYYEYDENNRLVAIKVCNPISKQLSHELNLYYGSSNDCLIKADDDRQIAYFFDDCQKHRDGENNLITHVQGLAGAFYDYTYVDHPVERKKLISRKSMPEGRFLETAYYKGKSNDVGGTKIIIDNPLRDGRIGRVKWQKAPVGPDGAPVIISKFFYHPGYTDVINSQEHKTRYHYSQEGLVTCMETFKGELAYKKKNYYWNNDKQLTAKILDNAKGHTEYCINYDYDENGHLISETIYGNLSGTCKTKILIDKNGRPKNKDHLESATRKYRWSKSKANPRLISQTDENGTKTRYLYRQPDKLRMGMLICDSNGKICIRQFYRYDDNGLLIETINDDGQSEDSNDLTGVTERHIARIEINEGHPGNEMPKTIADYCLDMKTGAEILLRRTVNYYSPLGQAVRQDIYGSDGKFAYTISSEYDEAGRCVTHDDPVQGKIFRHYDANGNLLQEHNIPVSGKPTICNNSYDCANRLTASEVQSEKPVHYTYRYDTESHCIAAMEDGHETCYEYDDLGRQVKTVFPLVKNGEGNWIRPTVRQTFDICDRVVESRDALGYITSTHYNVRGSPTCIEYPDGTTERFLYGKDGNVKREENRQGLITTYQRDFLGRPVLQEVKTQNGRLVSSLHSYYSAFHLVKTIDHTGLTVSYKYDAAGRLCKMCSHQGPYRKTIIYSYNSLGQLKTTKEWFGNGPRDYVATISEHSLNNDKSSYKITDHTGNVLKQVLCLPQPPSCTDEMIVYDALGRIISLESKGSLVEYRYDAAGNIVRDIRKNILPDGSESTHCTSWRYGPCNRLEAVTDNCGTAQEQCTLYVYNERGLLSSMTKPDAVVLTYAYDDAGRMVSLKSSDRTVDYTYHYDERGQIIRVDDGIHGLSTLRSYSPFGELEQETLGNRLTLSRSWDGIGRQKELVLPDNSRIAYTYDAAYLRAIERHDKENNLQYVHTYAAYDLNGVLTEASLIKGLGRMTYHYDQASSSAGICTPYWSGSCSAGREFTVNDSAGEWRCLYELDEKGQVCKEPERQYSYDSLGNRYEECHTRFSENQLCKAGNKTLLYDANGNLVKEGDQAFYTYDALNRLISVKKGRTVVTYIYDAFHRRISKRSVRGAHVQDTCFIYDGDKEIGSTDREGNIRELRILGMGIGAEIGATVAIELQGKVYAPIHDLRGNICCLVDAATREVAETYRYSAFGEETVVPAIHPPLCPWRFAGKRTDAESGLVYFGRRYYAPQWGRWTTQDPLGHADGPNRYVYAHNNPLHGQDLYGLFSLGELCGTVSDYCVQTGRFLRNTLNGMRAESNFFDYYHTSATKVLEEFFGCGFLRFNGYYVHPLESGVFGEGEQNDKVRITMLNGIDNVRSYYKDCLEFLSLSHGGSNIHYIFRPTKGYTWDILSAFFIKCGYVSPYARELADTWKQLISDMGGEGTIIHYCHSLGGGDTLTAASLLTPEEKAMIKVYTLASPSLISESAGFQSVTNFVGVCDPIPLFDPLNYFKAFFNKNTPNVVWVGRYSSLVFHSFAHEHYANVISNLGAVFVEMYGTTP